MLHPNPKSKITLDTVKNDCAMVTFPDVCFLTKLVKLLPQQYILTANELHSGCYITTYILDDNIHGNTFTNKLHNQVHIIM